MEGMEPQHSHGRACDLIDRLAIRCIVAGQSRPAMSWQSLISEVEGLKVSSTQDKATGKRNLLDANSETCWTSREGVPQHVVLTFAHQVRLRRISLTFQGGFVGTRCSIFTMSEGMPNEEEAVAWQLLTTIYPDDVNRKQVFALPEPSPWMLQLKLSFEESSDFFGRIIIYELDMDGLANV